MENEDCPLCKGTKKIIKFAKRTMGYTLASGETEANTIDEHWEDCPPCVKETGYLQVEPIQLEVLGEDEITNLYQRLAFNIKALVLKKLQDNVRWVISNNFGTELSQATIIHNEKRGQLYRLKEPLWGNKKEKI